MFARPPAGLSASVEPFSCETRHRAFFGGTLPEIQSAQGYQANSSCMCKGLQVCWLFLRSCRAYDRYQVSSACRLHEALDLVKEMARSHRFMQAATLNSLVRALAPNSAARALRMVSFMTTLRLPTYHATSIALIGACARQHLSAEASDLYWWAAPCRPCPLLFYTCALYS